MDRQSGSAKWIGKVENKPFRGNPFCAVNEFIFVSSSANSSSFLTTRLGKVLSSKQIANTIANKNSNFSSIRGGGGNDASSKNANGVVAAYRHPPTNLLHNTVCPDWSEVNAALGYSALLIRIMFDAWKADDCSDNADQVHWTVVPRGNASRIIKYKSPQKYEGGVNAWTGIGISDKNTYDGIEMNGFDDSFASSNGHSLEGGENGETNNNHAHFHNPISNIQGSSLVYPLYCSQSTLPPLLSGSHYKPFNGGLTMLLIALRDLSDLARQKDRTATLPHQIDGDERGSNTSSRGGGDGAVTIGGISWSVKRDGKDEDFNRASKYFLTNLKWCLAFFCKQHY